MNYYKLIDGQTIVGIATSFDLRRFQQKHRILIVCDENSAQYIQYNDVLYYDLWMLQGIDAITSYRADIINIPYDEYCVLEQAFKTNETIEMPEGQMEDSVEEDQAVNSSDVTIDFIRNTKLKELNSTCNSIIVAGFDIVLSDNVSHHFSLSIQDQLNLITLSTLIASGETVIPYHADGELCQYYSIEDIEAVIKTAMSFKTYHVTYYNSLKSYVESLESIDDISGIYYGVQIPTEHQSDILKELIAQMDGVT